MLTLGFIIEALTGYQSAGAPQVITDVAIDSRMVIPGGLFVALPGERTDGHAYLRAAFQKGALAALIEKDVERDGGLPWTTLDVRQPLTFEQVTTLSVPVCLRVENSLTALQTVAKAWRQRLQNLRVIGITGSVGKTTSKELIATVLGTRYRTFKTEGNYNNEIGLPLMLLKISEATERAVLEMGFYKEGEIAFLCELARPHVGVVNNVYAVHLERAGTIENIIAGKGELIEALPPDGVAILNLDDPRVMQMRDRTRTARIFTYGLDPAADLWADEIESRGLAGVHFHLHYRRETLHVRLPMLGQHSVHTALRAAAVGLVEGLTWQEIIEGLQSIGAVQLRLVAVRGPGGSLILDDSYNASPESVIAALNLLHEMDGRKIAVLGDMLELGAYEEMGHRLVGRRARDVAHMLVTVGQRAQLIADEARSAGMKAANVIECKTNDDALPFLQNSIGAGDVVLFKASRGLRLDRLARALMDMEVEA